MNSYTLYIMKACLGITLFAITYYFFFRKDAALRLKRFFLLGGLIITFLIPLLALKSPEIVEYSTPVFETDELQFVPAETVIAPEIAETSPINWPTVMLALYFCGALILLFRNIFLILKWNNVWRKADRKEKGVAYSVNDEIFAVFSRIFLPESLKNSEDINSILLHEKAHVRQLHYIDLIIMEFVILATWFNPFTWLFARMLKENHEHLADREALQGGADPTHYRIQLLNQTMGVEVFSLSQQFNNSFIKNRFEMMKKSHSIRSGIIKVGILIPAILISLGFAVGKARHGTSISGKVVFADTGQPAIGSTLVIKNATTGAVVGKEGEYLLELKEREEVVFSHIGYKSQSHWFEPGEYRFVVLEREVVNLIPPVFIVDGVKTNYTNIDEINKDDIASIKSFDRFGKPGGKDMYVITTKKKATEQNSVVVDDIQNKETSNSVRIRQTYHPEFTTIDEAKKLIIIDGKKQTAETFQNLDPRSVKGISVTHLSDIQKKERQDGIEVVINVTTIISTNEISTVPTTDIHNKTINSSSHTGTTHDKTKESQTVKTQLQGFRILVEPTESKWYK